MIGFYVIILLCVSSIGVSLYDLLKRQGGNSPTLLCITSVILIIATISVQRRNEIDKKLRDNALGSVATYYEYRDTTFGGVMSNGDTLLVVSKRFERAK